MNPVHVHRAYVADNIAAVVCRPDMWLTVAEDGQTPDTWRPDTRADIWLHMTVEGETVGMYHLQKLNTVLIEIHALVLPEHRKAYSVQTGRAALQWILDNLPECRKVIAWVPVIFPNVKAFTISQGFVVEGVNTSSYLKNGELHDQTLLGIKREGIQ